MVHLFRLHLINNNFNSFFNLSKTDFNENKIAIKSKIKPISNQRKTIFLNKRDPLIVNSLKANNNVSKIKIREFVTLPKPNNALISYKNITEKLYNNEKFITSKEYLNDNQYLNSFNFSVPKINNTNELDSFKINQIPKKSLNQLLS